MPENSGFFPPWERVKRIFALGLPIMAGMSTYVFLELVDLLFVGRLGTTALASVGISVFLVFLFLAIFGGVSIAVQATTSRLVGEGKGDGKAREDVVDLGRYLRTTLVIVFTVIPPVSLLLVWFAGDLLSLMSDDPDVVVSGTWYLAWMFGVHRFISNCSHRLQDLLCN